MGLVWEVISNPLFFVIQYYKDFGGHRSQWIVIYSSVPVTPVIGNKTEQRPRIGDPYSHCRRQNIRENASAEI